MSTTAKSDPAMPGGLKIYLAEEKARAAKAAQEAKAAAREAKARGQRPDRPSRIVKHTHELAHLIVDIRRACHVRQAELAGRAGVSRQWLVGFEQAKPTCEIALVLRILETLGLEIELKPYEPRPPWLIRAKLDADARAHEIASARRKRRRSRREAERCHRINANTKGFIVDLE